MSCSLVSSLRKCCYLSARPETCELFVLEDVIDKQSWFCLKPQSFPFSLYIQQNDLLKELQRLRLVVLVLQISAQRESIWKLNFREAVTRLFLVYQLHLEKFIFYCDKKVTVMDLLPTRPEIGTFFVSFFSMVFEEIWTYFQGV